MNQHDAVTQLAALAQESRLGLYRQLVQAGSGGLPAGRIAERLGLPPSTLSFHLKELLRAGLIQSRQEGRHIYYTADYAAMTALIAFLTENCCGGEPCCPPAACTQGECS